MNRSVRGTVEQLHGVQALPADVCQAGGESSNRLPQRPVGIDHPTGRSGTLAPPDVARFLHGIPPVAIHTGEGYSHAVLRRSGVISQIATLHVNAEGIEVKFEYDLAAD